jgi:3-oxoacyl-[acyl-carrier protein] reductase
VTARVAVVTGAGRGIGAAVARRLAADGHTVVLLDRDGAAASDTAATIHAAGGRAEPYEADVALEPAVRSAVANVVAALGPPTILVNNAGFARDVPLPEMTTEDWDDVQAVHLRGTFLMTRTICGHMIEQGWGRIVNISSTSALGDDERANYVAAKAGIHGFTMACALDLGPHGITANTVAPGVTLTDMTVRSAARRGRTLEEHCRLAAEQIPVRRIGQPEDIAHVVSFFTAEESSYVTGQVLYASGGPHG